MAINRTWAKPVKPVTRNTFEYFDGREYNEEGYLPLGELEECPYSIGDRRRSEWMAGFLDRRTEYLFGDG